MSEELKEKLFHAFDQGWNKGNPEAMYELCDPYLIHYRPPLPAIHGLDAEKRDIDNTFKSYSDIRFTIHEMVMEGDTVVMRWAWTAKPIDKSSAYPNSSSSEMITMDGCSIIHLSNGKIIDEWEFADLLGYFIQRGDVPSIDDW